ncbi:MAG: hypothetical protein M3Z30_13545 [Gemmatimonadota bacterium]|nr:hypothetical protein [Gemmatimonadota bacterium]
MRPRFARLAVLSLALAGCASASTVQRNEDPVIVMMSGSSSLRYNKDVHVVTTRLTGPPSTHWAQLQAAYASLGLPLTARDTAEHALAAQNAQLSGRFNNAPVSRIVDCGMTPYGSERANAYKIWLTVASQLQSGGMTGEDTDLRTSIAANAQEQTSSTAAVQCGTTGVLEAQIAKLLGAP